MSAPDVAADATAALPVPASPSNRPPASAAPVVMPPDRVVGLPHTHSVASALLPHLQYRLTRLGVAGQAGLAALAAAVAVAVIALIPAQQRLRALNEDLARPRHQADSARIEQAVPRLVQSLPVRGALTGVIAQVFAQAKAAGVAIDKGRYAYAPAKSGVIERYELEFPVKAPYPQIRTFIDSTLKTLPAAALDKLRLERKAVGEQAVNADVGFVVFVRGEKAP